MPAKNRKVRRIDLVKRSTEASHREYASLINVAGGLVADPVLETCDLNTVGGVSAVLSHADALVDQLYSTPDEFFRSRQIAALVRKYPFPGRLNPYNPEREGRRTFAAVERRNARINRRFSLLRGPYRGIKQRTFSPNLELMRAYIAYVIGDRPDLGQVWDECGFGPGASIGVSGNATNIGRKLLSSKWSVTPGAFHYACAAINRNQHLREVLLRDVPPDDRSTPWVCRKTLGERANVVRYNNIAFVPKTAKTHRVIAVEPLLNSYIQKGIDNYMRQRLRRVGVDLSDQSWNAEMARLGSIGVPEGDPYVTIDLQNASDSICTEVVRWVLSPEWFEFLDAIRCKYYRLDGREHRSEKFCSMGNGFSFPLESLIFRAAAHASGAIQGEVAVYGDDIVVRRSVADLLIPLLEFLGFKTNRKKTFLDGPFRESCGSNWFGGVDVTPWTLDSAFPDVREWFKAFNSVVSHPKRRALLDGLLPYIMEKVPKRSRLVRPYPGPPDSAMTVELDQFMASPFARWNKSIWCWTWTELLTRPVLDLDGIRVTEGVPSAHVYAALSGHRSEALLAIRRKTKTRVRRVSHSGATSKWLPGTS